MLAASEGSSREWRCRGHHGPLPLHLHLHLLRTGWKLHLHLPLLLLLLLLRVAPCVNTLIGSCQAQEDFL